jgi:GDP-L-fucose synthase
LCPVPCLSSLAPKNLIKLIKNDNTVAASSSGFEVWGTGTPRREFLHVDDLASACSFVMALDDASYAAYTQPMRSHLNVGTGKDIKIKELAELIGEVVGFKGEIIFNPKKPDGAPRKLLNVNRIQALGWQPEIDLRSGLEGTYQWFLDNRSL